MTVKTNESTYNRPEGARLINAAMVPVNIQHFINEIKGEKAWKENDRNGITVYKSPGVSMVLTALHKGAKMKDIEVEGLIIVQVMEGEVFLQTNAEEIILKEKQLLVIRQGLKNQLTANTEAVILLSHILITALSGTTDSVL